MRFIELHAIAGGDRLEMVARIREALTASGAWITGHQQFSNLSLNIRFEIAAEHLSGLERQLMLTGAQLDFDTIRHIRQPSSDGEISGTLQILFIHDEPDLRQEIPPIPG